ncbi:MAG: ATP-binding cassette domain-containing protein [Saprospiraceae bacterium]|nr:ATP-binding cassette domain-containing protein [Saprospiraceae bacterium]
MNTAEGKIELELNCQLHEGEFVAIYGASGTGKTSILRMLGGLLQAESGRIQVGDKVWYDTTCKVNIPTHLRSIGFMFQDYALFPNMTVRQNLTFALNKKQSTVMVEELLEVMELQQLQAQNQTIFPVVNSSEWH